jgi:hypothetical protein
MSHNVQCLRLLTFNLVLANAGWLQIYHNPPTESS